jgi:hypothetical protein
MSTEFANQNNQQWRSKDVIFRAIKLKGIDTQVFEDGELLAYDPADDTFIQYTGAAAQLVAAILSLGVGESITIAVADTLTPDATACIGGEVITDYLKFPAGVAIDDRPNAAVQSVRLQLREVGIIARDTDEINESNLT